MGQDEGKRRLAAIACADIAGWTRLTEADEEGTLAALKGHRAAVDVLLVQHRGRIFNTTGDGFLAEFASVVDAVRWAIALQDAMAMRNATAAPERRLQFRIGIHLADVMVDGDNLYGEGVNLAARLQQVAAPGGICLSGPVVENVRQRVDAAFVELGRQSLKNIAQPVAVFAVARGAAEVLAPPTSAPLPLPEKPSIIVLPFDDLSGDAAQGYLADGMCEEITAALARIPALFVIARNTAFTYKGTRLDVRELAGQLGVRYVLAGSIRSGAARIRVTAQLIEAAGRESLWSERYDRPLDDIFAVQDEIAGQIVGALSPSIYLAEAHRAARQTPSSLDAWGLTMRALVELGRAGILHDEGNRAAVALAERACALTPDYALAHAALALLLGYRCYARWEETWLATAREAAAHGRRALQHGSDDPDVLAHVALSLIVLGEFGKGRVLAERTLAINPNSALAHMANAFTAGADGEIAEARLGYAHASRLSPRDPMQFFFATCAAFSELIAGDHAAALEAANRALNARPGHMDSMVAKAAALVGLGRKAEADRLIAEAKARFPTLTLAIWQTPSTGGKAWPRLVEALAATGLR